MIIASRKMQLRSIGVGVAVGLLVLALSFVAIFVVPHLYWHWNDRGLVVLSAATELARAVDSFHAEKGRYPQTVTEYRAVESYGNRATGLVDRIIHASEFVGCPLTEVIVPREGFEHPSAPLVVISGERGRIEIYESGRIGISACLLPRRVVRSPGDKLIILSNEPWPDDHH